MSPGRGPDSPGPGGRGPGRVWTRVLVAGWPSLSEGEATAGDVLAMDAVAAELVAGGIPGDLAWSPVLRPGGLSLEAADPARYTHLVFACGPLSGPGIAALHEKFRDCRRIAIGVSVPDPADPAAMGFHTILPRDAPGIPPSGDLSADALNWRPGPGRHLYANPRRDPNPPRNVDVRGGVGAPHHADVVGGVATSREADVSGGMAAPRAVDVRGGVGAPRDVNEPCGLPRPRDGVQGRDTPVAGVIMVARQAEYGDRAEHEPVAAALDDWLRGCGCARIPLDTRLDPRDWRLCGTPGEFEAIVGRLDLVVTMRLHGLVLALTQGVPALAVDPVAGGAKVSAQARAWRWPAVVTPGPDGRPAPANLDHWRDWCLSPAGRAAAALASAKPPASPLSALLAALYTPATPAP